MKLSAHRAAEGLCNRHVVSALSLPKAKKLGINRVLITCNKENTASARTIQENGGIMENEVLIDGLWVQRYWLN